MWLTG